MELRPLPQQGSGQALGATGDRDFRSTALMLDQGPDVPRGVQEALGKAQATHSFCQQLPAGPPLPLEADLGGGVSSSDVFGVSSGLAEEVVARDQRQGRQGGQGLPLGSSPSGSPDGTCPSVEGHIPGWRSSPDASLWVL